MDFLKKELANGLVIIGERNAQAKSAAVGFFTKTGSRDETEQINGVSHFLEHMMFKGNERLSALEVNEAFDRTGAQFNAFTSEESTVYYAAVLPEYLPEITSLWCELMRPALRDEDFNIEKNVIKEEIAMYQDMPTFDVIDRCRSLHFGEHPCGNSVLGTVESIDALTAEQMREYFRRRYSPNNMVLSVAGDFDWETICNEAEQKCAAWQPAEASRRQDDFSGSIKKGSHSKSNLSCEHICLMSHAVSAQDKRRFAASVLATIIGDDTGSRFFWGLVDKALAEAASLHFNAMDGTGMFYSYIRCNPDNTKQVMKTVDSIFADIQKDGIDEHELIKAKNKILSALVIKNEQPMGRLIDLGFNWQYLGQYREVTEDVAAVKAVTVQDIEDFAKTFDLGRYTQYNLVPEKA